MRRVIRWGLWLAAIAAGGAVLVALAALIAAHTQWGRDELRARVEAALARALPGGARIGRVEGSLFGTVIVHDVVLDGRDRQPIVAVGTLRARISLWPLASDTVRVDDAVAEDVRVTVHRQPPGPPPGPRRPRSAWHAELPHIAVHRATVELSFGGTTQTLAGIDALGSVTVDDHGVTIAGWGHGRWQDLGAEITATATVVVDGTVRIPGAEVTLGEIAIVGSQLAIDPEHPSGAAWISAPASGLRTRLPELGPVIGGDLVATLELAATGPATSRLVVDATAGDQVLHARLDGEPALRSARGVIAASSLDLAAVTGQRIAGRGQVIAALDGGATGVRGTLLVHCEPGEPSAEPGAGPVRCGSAEQPLHDAMIAIDGAFDASGDLRLRAFALGHGAGGAQAFASASGHRTGAAIVIDDARAAASVTAATVGRQRVTGWVSVTAAARGALAPARDLDVTASARAGGLAAARFALATASAGLHLRIAPRPRLERAQISAAGLRYGDTPLGAVDATIAGRGAGYDLTAHARPSPAVAIDLDGLVTHAAGRTALTVQHSRVAHGTIAWTGDTGSIAITAQTIAVRGVALGGGEAALELGGALDRPSGALTAHVAARGLSGKAFELAGIAEQVRGRGALDVTRRAGRWQAEAQLDFTGIAAEAGAPPLDGSVHASLAGARATVAAELHGPALGAVELGFDATAPAQPFDLAAWRALEASAIHQATVTAHGVQTAALAALAGIAPWTGTLDGAIDLAPTALHGSLALRAAGLPFGGLEGDLTLASRDGDLGVAVSARVAGVATAGLTARLALPAHPFDPATWRRGGRDLLREAAFDLEDIAFDPARLAQLGLAQAAARHGIALPYRGHASARLALGAAADQAELTVELTGVTGATGSAPVEPVSQHLAITADPSGTRARASWTTATGLALGALDAALPVSPDHWLSDPGSALRAPLTAHWQLAAVPLPAVLRLFGHRELSGGTLEGSADLRGTLGAPIVEPLRLVARNATVAPRLGAHAAAGLAELEAVAQLGPAGFGVELTGRDTTGGQLHATARAAASALAQPTATITAHRLDVSLLGALIPRALVPTAGVIDAQLGFAGGGQLTGAVKLSGGELPIAPSVGTLHDVSADLALGATVTGTLDGKLGRGTVHGVFATATPTTAKLTLNLRNVVALGGLHPNITADLQAPCIDLDAAEPRLCGDVIVSGGVVTIPERPGTPLLDPRAPPDLVFIGDAAPAAARPPGAPWLVADIVLRDTRVDAASIDGVSFRTSLHSRGKLRLSLGEPIGLIGDVQIDAGDVDLLGRRYTLSPSELAFDGTIDPSVRVQLSHDFSELTLNAVVTGRASHLDRPQLSSDPGGYTDDQLWGFLIGGEPGTDPSTQTRDALVGAAARGLSGTLGKQLSRVLPIQLDVSCEPATTVTRASCSVGKWFSDRMFLTVRQVLDAQPDENASSLDLQYRLGRKSLELSGGDRAHYGADVVWRHRW